MYNLSDYNYDLPDDLIAQQPMKQRDHSRLLRLDRKSGQVEHRFFHEIADFLRPDDILVVNNTQVVPARLFGTKESGGKAEVLLLEYFDYSRGEKSEKNCVFKCLIKSSKRPKPGNVIYFDEDLSATVVNNENGFFHVKFSCPGNFDDILHRVGKMPIPPYIRRDQKSGDFSGDKKSYQTVYASQKGAVAAPTAGLHFTETLLDNIGKKGIEIVPITLHVGYGTFVPVRASDIRNHRIHSERFDISEEAAQAINDGIRQNLRIVAVGTTCVRTLEYALNEYGQIVPGSDTCDLFIYPGYRFKVVDAMITNFHLPESTLIMLVSAFAGREKILAAYQNAVENKYRFYSYGDAMFIE
ncbi:MAG: tRNA preQ1(34) S-adenosylmethionine ribosyltransferase-isomerase QueA [Desulfobacterales bacterium]|jgi:S-adenosylmethionine:tRNA ribosyltransferase-isomerase|nr:tRNA preQ1(34) S-adenosylmethionine ribosyltransferase-isomerase QueA [Desulfobacterales bacterium]